MPKGRVHRTGAEQEGRRSGVQSRQATLWKAIDRKELKDSQLYGSSLTDENKTINHR